VENNQILWVWAIVGVAAVWIAISIIRDWMARARLDGMKEAANVMIRNISFHYERKDEPLPEEIDKAIEDMHSRVGRKKNDHERAEAYLIGAGVLADKMGEAAFNRGTDVGRDWQEPREGDYRIDLPMQSWMTLRSLAHNGFLHWMPHYTPMLEFHCRTKEEAEPLRPSSRRWNSRYQSTSAAIRNTLCPSAATCWCGTGTSSPPPRFRPLLDELTFRLCIDRMFGFRPSDTGGALLCAPSCN
jgi:hypothetical protein